MARDEGDRGARHRVLSAGHAKLHTTWGKPSARPTIESLLNDDRGGSRQGFSLRAYRDLLFLIEIVTELEAMAREEEDREGIRRKLQTAG